MSVRHSFSALTGWVLLASGLILNCGQAATPAVDSGDYKGWVHIQGKSLGVSQPAILAEAADGEEGEEEATEVYINKAIGGKAIVLMMPGRTLTRLWICNEKLMSLYDSKQNGVAMGEMDPVTLRKTAMEVAAYPLTVEAVMSDLKKEGATIVKCQETREGSLIRYDVSFIGGKACKTSKDSEESVGSQTLWIDAKTRLIQKVQTHLDEPKEFTYTYEKRAIKDVFDIGVPRNVLILDSRPTKEAVKVLDRVDGRAKKDFGDYVAVLAETDRRKAWGSKKMFLHLYAREGEKGLYCQFGFNEKVYPDSPMLKIKGWPNPDVKDVLELAKKTIPVFYYATDGTKAWSGTFQEAATDIKIRLRDREQLIKENPFTHEFKLSNHIWRNRESLYLYGYGPKADTITDAKRAGLIGLRLREGDYSTDEPRGGRRQERVFWLDPKRDDIPAEIIFVGERSGAKELMSKTLFHTRYLEFAKLPNGQWYPAHWTNDMSRQDFERKSKDGFVREFHLRIVPDMKVDGSWYGRRSTVLGIAQPTVVTGNK